jgi:hypothetical protein
MWTEDLHNLLAIFTLFQRFNSAINLLGSSETSARTGAIYTLHELALEEGKYRQQIVQILCSHVRFCYFCKILCV